MRVKRALPLKCNCGRSVDYYYAFYSKESPMAFRCGHGNTRRNIRNIKYSVVSTFVCGNIGQCSSCYKRFRRHGRVK